MKKLMYIFSLFLLFLGACSNESSSDGSSLEEAFSEMKKVIAENSRGSDGKLKDGQIEGYISSSLTGEDVHEWLKQYIENMGLDLELLEEGYMLKSELDLNSDQIILLKAKNEKDVDQLKATLEKELEMQEQLWANYLVEQYKKVQKTIIKSDGPYVIYITSDDPEKMESIFDEKLQ